MSLWCRGRTSHNGPDRLRQGDGGIQVRAGDGLFPFKSDQNIKANDDVEQFVPQLAAA